MVKPERARKTQSEPKPADIAINPSPPITPGPVVPVWPKRKLEF